MDDPSGTEQTPEADAGRLAGGPSDSEVFEPRTWMRPHGLADAAAERLGRALSNPVEGVRSLVLYALVQPVGVRASTAEAAPSPARLVLPDGAAERLGVDLETHLTVGAGEIRLWLAGFERVPPGSTVTLTASGASGKAVQASVVAGDDLSPIRISAPWDEEGPPEAIALGFDL